ncbi:MAG: pyridoxal-dependent decarboxylase, partial [Candidatus Kapaibacteriota bacterium]
GIQLGRRFRALKLWFVLRSYGLSGLMNKLRFHLNLANQLKELIEQDCRFELLAPSNFTTICFRFKPKNLSEEEINVINKKLLEEINSSGFAFLSHTVLNEKFAIRFSIGQTNTQLEDVLETWNLIQKVAERIEKNGTQT